MTGIHGMHDICIISCRGWNFSPHYHCIQNGAGAHSASYPTGTRGTFPEGKVTREPTTHLHLVLRSRMHGAVTFMVA